MIASLPSELRVVEWVVTRPIASSVLGAAGLGGVTLGAGQGCNPNVLPSTLAGLGGLAQPLASAAGALGLSCFIEGLLGLFQLLTFAIALIAIALVALAIIEWKRYRLERAARKGGTSGTYHVAEHGLVHEEHGVETHLPWEADKVTVKERLGLVYLVTDAKKGTFAVSRQALVAQGADETFRALAKLPPKGKKKASPHAA